MPKVYDFSGYATKNDLKCSDGRTIRKDAFKDNDGQTVPLVWQHSHNDPTNVLGHALLENRKDGVYAYCTFNNTEAGQNAKELVKHGDITALSIYANKLKQSSGNVTHGVIREVSLVLAGANPGALIDNIAIAHADGTYTESEDEAIIYSGGNLSMNEEENKKDVDNDEVSHAEGGDKTIKEVFDTLNEEQKTAVYAMLAYAAEGKTDETVNHSEEDEGGESMKHNVFDNENNEEVLTHADVQSIIATAQDCGSLKKAVLMHAQEYGIHDIENLFPDAKSASKEPEWIKREDEWVPVILNGVSKSPFSRIKAHYFNMNFDEARAKGYIKATEKKEVYLKNSKRSITPTTIYVKQKLDRDDIIDITDFDIVAAVRKELRILLNEEIARAILIGDGRDDEDPDKISEDFILPIYKDNEFYVDRQEVTAKDNYKAFVKQVALAHKHYKGTGSAVMFMTPDLHTNLLWIEDNNGRRIYEDEAKLCSALRVSKIVEIPQFESTSRKDEDGKTKELVAMKVNLSDYKIGNDRGGEINSFDDFDIDFNQYKYLMETRLSGMMTKYKGAQIFEHTVDAGAQG